MGRFETYNFTSDFQDMILACLIRHPEDFWAFGEIVRPEFFTGPAACELVFRLNEYRKKYGGYPKFSALGNFAFHKASRVNIDHAKDTLDYVAKLSQIQIDSTDQKAILDLSVKFAQERAIHDAIRKIHSAQTEGNGEQVDPVALMQEAVKIGTNLNDLGLSLYHDSDKIIDQISAREYGIHSYASFENLWKFGWAPGWLIVLLAPPKRYKTAFAINLALEIAKKQYADVLYYACEISQELAAFRALCNITNLTQDDFWQNPEHGKRVAANKLKQKLWGNIWFKGFPSKSTTIGEIKSHARQVIDIFGLHPKAIVIDYAETVKPDKVNKDTPDWRQQADIYTQARAMGAEFGCTMILPDRCNRETVGRKVPNMKSFQGAFEKAGIVDAAIGLCMTEAEYKMNRIRYFVFLNRHGEAFKHYTGTVDPQRMKMTVEREIDYTPDDEDSKPKTRPTNKGASMTQSDERC